MNKNHIKCLERLNDLTGAMSEILGFLLSEKLISREEIKGIMESSDRVKMTSAKLAALQSEDKLQLLEYEWQLLPIERIKITIITDRSSKEFTYG